MTLPAKAPYCLKCQSFTTLEHGGTECETCGGRRVEMRAVAPVMETPPQEKPRPRQSPIVAPNTEHADSLFDQLRKSL